MGVFTWVDGENVGVGTIAPEAAGRARGLILALRRLDPTDAPPDCGAARSATSTTGCAAASRNSTAHDGEELLAAWDGRSNLRAWDGPPTWCHCDLDLRNVLFRDGRPTASSTGAARRGDPASDALRRVEDAARRGRGGLLDSARADDWRRSSAPAAGRSCSARERSVTDAPEDNPRPLRGRALAPARLSSGSAPRRSGRPASVRNCVDLRDRPRVRRDELREAARGDDRGVRRRRAPRGSGRRSSRPGPRSRRRGRTAAPASSSAR